MDNRPTFFNDNDNQPIRAGGIIFYKIDPLTKQIKMLMQYTQRIDQKTNIKRNVYEDIGGKTDEKDNNINDTIMREVVEETNGIITKEIVQEHLDKEHHKMNQAYYLKHSKYYLILIEANKTIVDVDRRAYGKKEINGKLRQFHWIDAYRLNIKGTPFNERIWFLRKEINNFFSTLI
jgi:hypothetical protein